MEPGGSWLALLLPWRVPALPAAQISTPRQGEAVSLRASRNPGSKQQPWLGPGQQEAGVVLKGKAELSPEISFVLPHGHAMVFTGCH